MSKFKIIRYIYQSFYIYEKYFVSLIRNINSVSIHSMVITTNAQTIRQPCDLMYISNPSSHLFFAHPV